ncbi:Carbohydrate-binding WSC, subgroup [Moelleriella libera RCEF 2490]|uniref:Carbohydrate-binding WSC, subgroup n=1 Tax=Moelleriella libera RCEF 2490 TaxID=1081109 RepID=A0A166RMB4_9HYPO|nr:Carbohydrate-binding WSC, subgroup [Moelleriella libera RCEF 2490]
MTLYRSILAAAAVAVLPLTQAWNIELPPCVSPFKPFVYSGCYQDGSPNALVFRSSLDQTNMTVEKCMADCKGNGFRYAGLEYYGVCFCGGTVNGAKLDESKCSFPCSGNKSETCGGDSTLSVWQDPTFPTEDVTVDSYKSLGCYTDDSQKGRALSYPINLDASTFTTKGCLAACEKQGFPFAGTEYGKECWCGSVLANDTAKVDDSQCNVPCQGNTSDTCGGSSRLSLWVAKDLESLEPCGSSPGTTTTTWATTTSSLPGSSTTSQPIGTTSTSSPVGTTSSCTTSSSVPTTSTSPVIPTTSTTPVVPTTSTTPVVPTTSTTPVVPTTSTTPVVPTTSTTPVVPTTSTTPVVPTTSTTPVVPTTSTTPVVPTTSTTPVVPTTSTTPVIPTTSTQPVITTTTKGAPTTTTGGLCTATVTVPPKCEWQCGSWCAPALPTWGDKPGCAAAQKTCRQQVSSCFKNAGFPGAIECFKFKAWCLYIDSYCQSDCPGKNCGKWDCWNKHQGGSGKAPANPPTTTTTVYPCAPTKPVVTTTKPVTSCSPQPTNICTQPSNDLCGYGPGKPVGGIALPVVGCNDCQDEFNDKPFKYFNDADTRKCPGFTWPKWSNVCGQACKDQFDQCVAVYSKGCSDQGWKNDAYKRANETPEEFSKRWFSFPNWGSGLWGGGDNTCAAATGSAGSWTAGGSDSLQCWGWGGNNPIWAIARCKIQYADCLKVNAWVNPKDQCKAWPGC